MKIKYYKVPSNKSDQKEVAVLALSIGAGQELRATPDLDIHGKVRSLDFSKYQVEKIDELVRKIIYFYENN